uniref:NADH-ubiquinone oxidoreductase chain 2 n=1 Tax=Lednia tumana TaxID=466727 RepID=A0A4D6Q114_9NEOP|nr:NADH dehydrogenase subunit 2 [Lednia tumana]QCF39710.1 NADH dehydrogenase subunit 2 [Lednia tumana]WOL43199.1 NADH dehydrogenase subunit 2 [Lednia tumana]
MLNNPTKFLFLLTLMAGTLIATSANSWFGAWMGLEINLLSFIPLMTNSKNLFLTEASLKYFLVQALASATLLLSVILGSFLSSSPYEDSTGTLNVMNTVISSTLLLKMGAAPFHFWFPGVMEGLNWMNGLMLLTWQKIAPLMLISYTFQMNIFFSVIITLCVLVGSLGGFNQTSLRKILAYSSINHLGWLLAAMAAGESIWCLYFLVYTFLSLTIIFLMNSFKLFHVNQIFSLNHINPIHKFAFFVTLLSLGGLPPFLGFLPKWIVIQSLINTGNNFLITVMVITTLITLFYYLRTTFGAFMLTYSETLWNTPTPVIKTTHTVALILAIMSTLGLLICSILFSIL